MLSDDRGRMSARLIALLGLAPALIGPLSIEPASGETQVWFRDGERRWLAKELRIRGHACAELRAGFHLGRQRDGEHFRVVCAAGGEVEEVRLVTRTAGIARTEPRRGPRPLFAAAALRPSLD
jgi:hypothetical protein